MPIHDWRRVDVGLFHAFRFHWNVTICDALNGGGLPGDHFALLEQNVQRLIPDALALKLAATMSDDSPELSCGLAVADVPPKMRCFRSSEASLYAEKADHITVRHRQGDVVAVIDIVSPGNKSSNAAFKMFVEKSTDYLRQHVHLLVIDPHLPSKRDPQGVHPEIWAAFVDDDDEPHQLPPRKPFTFVSYDAGPPQVAYIDNVAIGDSLPEMPIFLMPEVYVPVSLETTYLEAWKRFPNPLKHLLT